ncbi:MAG: hypothetical protein ACFHWX_15700 [Bacteroidota bacterium]
MKIFGLDFSDLFKDVNYSVNEKVRNPIYLSFIITWIGYNWKFLLLLFNLGEFKGLDKQIDAISNSEIFFWEPLGYAFIVSIGYFIISFFGLTLSVFFNDRLRPHLVKFISSKRVRNIEQLEAKELRIKELESDKMVTDNQLDLAQKNSRDLREKIKGLESQIANLQSQLQEKDENRNQELVDRRKEVEILLNSVNEKNILLAEGYRILDTLNEENEFQNRDKIENWLKKTVNISPK